MLDRSIYQEDLTIINIYTPNTGASKYRKQMLIYQKKEVHSNTITSGDLKPHFQQWINHPDKYSIRKHWT